MDGNEASHLGCAVTQHGLFFQPDPRGQSIEMHEAASGSFDEVEDALLAVVQAHSITPEGLGISVGGHVDSQAGVVVYAPDVVRVGCDWTDIHAAERISARLGLPVSIHNDVNCMARWHSLHGQAKGSECAVVVYLAPEGRGLGSAIVLKGRPFVGRDGGAGELGHVVLQPTGARCRCGNRGCVEALLSKDTLTREVNWGGRQQAKGLIHVARLAEDGVPEARIAIARAGRYLGQSLATIVNLFNPDRILIGGGHELLPKESESPPPWSLWAQMRDSLHDQVFGRFMKNCLVFPAQLDAGIAARGAAILSAEQQR